MSLNNYIPHENRKRQKLYILLRNVLTKLLTTIYSQKQNKEKYEPFKTLCGTQSKNFHANVWKVSLENTTTW